MAMMKSRISKFLHIEVVKKRRGSIYAHHRRYLLLKTNKLTIGNFGGYDGRVETFYGDDAEALRQLHDRGMTEEDIRGMIRAWNRLEYQGKYFEMFAIVEGGNLAGELSLYAHSASVVSVGIEVFPPFRGQGLGKQAMNSALQICRDRGFRIVCDQVRTDNEPSIALHRSAGFESDLYRYRNQKGTDIYLFLKALDSIP